MFVQSLLFAPFLACFSMGVASALIGVILLYERKSLFGEALSHVAYPGVVLGAFLAAMFSFDEELSITLFVFAGALLSSMVGIGLFHWLQKTRWMTADGALSFLLSSSFALALFMISVLQHQYSGIGGVMQNLLIGQAATVSNAYAWLSFFFSLVVVLSLFLLHRSLFVTLFDREFARLHQLTSSLIDLFLLVLMAISVMIGIRTMGVVLLTSALLFPALSSRYLARSFKGQLLFSLLLGGIVSLLGVWISYRCSFHLVDATGRALWLPTGPIIALLFQTVFLFLFLFSWNDGLVVRGIRMKIFHFRCKAENGLKQLWKTCSQAKSCEIDRDRLRFLLQEGFSSRLGILLFLKYRGYIKLTRSKCVLTPLGLLRGQKLVRLHRLWELYLVRYCKMSEERVHPQAEEMEHILTPEVERELVRLLKNPTVDPHLSPIPPESDELLLEGGK